MDEALPQSIYSIKKFGTNGRLITQNKNGPCPILAIYNVLGLRGTINIPPTSGISAEEMVSHIGSVFELIYTSRLLRLNSIRGLRDFLDILKILHIGELVLSTEIPNMENSSDNPEGDRVRVLQANKQAAFDVCLVCSN